MRVNGRGDGAGLARPAGRRVALNWTAERLFSLAAEEFTMAVLGHPICSDQSEPGIRLPSSSQMPASSSLHQGAVTPPLGQSCCSPQAVAPGIRGGTASRKSGRTRESRRPRRRLRRLRRRNLDAGRHQAAQDHFRNSLRPLPADRDHIPADVATIGVDGLGNDLEQVLTPPERHGSLPQVDRPAGAHQHVGRAALAAPEPQPAPGMRWAPTPIERPRLDEAEMPAAPAIEPEDPEPLRQIAQPLRSLMTSDQGRLTVLLMFS
jgi:hypothetical protein